MTDELVVVHVAQQLFTLRDMLMELHPPRTDAAMSVGSALRQLGFDPDERVTLDVILECDDCAIDLCSDHEHALNWW